MKLLLILNYIIYPIFLGFYITLTQLYNNKIWFKDYPLAIQEKAIKPNRKDKIISIILGGLFLLLMFGYPVFSIFFATPVIKSKFIYAFLYVFSIGFAFNLFDLLVLDFLIFCKWTPRYLVLENTLGMSEYKDYKFHLVGFAKGCLIFGIYAFIVALIFNVII